MLVSNMLTFFYCHYYAVKDLSFAEKIKSWTSISFWSR